MVFCKKKTAKRSFSIMASLLFTVFLSAPPGRPPPRKGGGRPGGDKTFRGGLTLLLMTSKQQRRSRRCSYGRTASLIKTSFSQRHGSSCRSTSALSEVEAGNAALSGRSHKLAAPPAEVTRVYDHIIRLPMHPFVKDAIRKTCRKKEEKEKCGNVKHGSHPPPRTKPQRRSRLLDAALRRVGILRRSRLV